MLPRTVDSARGKWPGILRYCGASEALLSGKHTVCPFCQRKDKFRFDNSRGEGTWICVCDAGGGMALVMQLTGKSFSEAAAMVDAILSNKNICESQAAKAEMSDDERRRLLRQAWVQSSPMQAGDLADKYLASRNLNEPTYPASLRFAPKMTDGEGGIHPCMVAVVSDHTGKPCSLHRTFLRADGNGKAEIASPRKLMPGALADGACVRLSEWMGGPLGIAEGIETAMAASALYGTPVWSALNTSLLAKWLPPEGCNEVVIFGDHDESFAGHKAAYELAFRLKGRKIAVEVHFPAQCGTDFADVWLARASSNPTGVAM